MELFKNINKPRTYNYCALSFYIQWTTLTTNFGLHPTISRCQSEVHYEYIDTCTWLQRTWNTVNVFMPRLGGAYCFRRVHSQRKSVDWGTMGPALGGAYECYAHIFSFLRFPRFGCWHGLLQIPQSGPPTVFSENFPICQE